MRILLANEARRGGGGVETYLASITRALTMRGHDAALLYANPSSEDGPTGIATAESWSAADLGVERAVASAMAWRPDVVFSHNMRRLDIDEALVGRTRVVKMMHGYFGTCVSGQKAFASPTVSTCTRICGPGCLVLYGPRRCGRLDPIDALANYQWAKRQRRLLGRYRSIVVASRHMRAEYLAHGVEPARVNAIPLFAETPANARPRAAAERASVDVAFVGRLTKLKGPALAVRAAAVASRMVGRPVSATLAGEGPERGGLEAAAGSNPHVVLTFTGWLDARARTDLLAAASVLVVPSLWPEPFGLIGLEAAALGVPAIAFNVGGIGDWLTDEVNGLLVPPGDAEAMGGAIARLLRDRAERARLSAGALATASRLSADAHLSQLERILAA